MKKVYPKSKNPIFYSRNVGGKVYKLTITSEGLDISKFPDELVEDLFQTWGKHLLNEDQQKAVQDQAPKVEPVKQEEPTSEPQPEQQPESVEVPQVEEKPQVEEEKKEEPVSEPAPVEEVKEVKTEEIIPQPEEKKEEPKPEVVKHKGRGNFRRN